MSNTAPTVASVYFHWGVVQVSLANLLVVAIMIAVFALALLLPFPHGSADEDQAGDRDVDR